MHIAGDARRKDAGNFTAGGLAPAQKAAKFDEWQLFTANSGTYAVKGNTLTRRRLVAKNVFAMEPVAKPLVGQFKLEGDTLWITADTEGGQTRYKLTRVR